MTGSEDSDGGSLAQIKDLSMEDEAATCALCWGGPTAPAGEATFLVGDTCVSMALDCSTPAETAARKAELTRVVSAEVARLILVEDRQRRPRVGQAVQAADFKRAPAPNGSGLKIVLQRPLGAERHAH